MIEWIVVVLIALGILIRLKRRKYFWKDKKGNELNLKEFLKKWKEGVINITPLQQTKTSLWSTIPIFAGLIWGMVVTFIAGVYWMTLILTFSLPLVSMNFISTIQKYRAQKRAHEAFQEAMNQTKKIGGKNEIILGTKKRRRS